MPRSVLYSSFIVPGKLKTEYHDISQLLTEQSPLMRKAVYVTRALPGTVNGMYSYTQYSTTGCAYEYLYQMSINIIPRSKPGVLVLANLPIGAF